MIDLNLDIKTIEELCSWFMAETDWLADCIDGELMQGKQPDNALIKKVRSRLAAYCAYTKQSPISFTEVRYDQELGKILFPEGMDYVSHCSGEEAFSLILEFFLGDIRDLFQRVLTNDPKDPHFSAVTAEKKAALYLKCLNRSFSYSLESFWKEQGYHQEEIRQFYENYRREYPYYTGKMPPV